MDMPDPISVEEAKAVVAANFHPGGLAGNDSEIDTVSRDSAMGRALADPVASTEDIPPFDNSAMDGYAVRSTDLKVVPGKLRLQAEVRAGEVYTGEIEAGSCVRIMTGAPIPNGADAVAPVEWTAGWVDSGDVSIHTAPKPGQHVRLAGRDVRRGDDVFGVGTIVTPPVVGMLAALGRTDVRVFRQPTVAVIATGDELVDDGSALRAGQIRNSNGPGLAAQSASAGARVLYQVVARDDEASVRSHIERGLDADILLISGGVSVGAYDFVRPALEALSVEILFWRVRQRPGKPLAFGRNETAAVFGLPGNPVSSAICFEQYVRPAIRTFVGDNEPTRTFAARLVAPIDKKGDLHYFARGIVTQLADGTFEVALAGEQGSNIYSSMVQSNCMVHLPEGASALAAGDAVVVEPYSWAAA